MSAFKTIHFGQKALHFTTPKEIVDEINETYDKHIQELKPHNVHLAGKIEDEHRIDNKLSNYVKRYFKDCFRIYVYECKVMKTINLQTAWVNQMKANEYNPFHFHVGSKGNIVGLTSVMMLKKPNTYGKEYSRPSFPSNGNLELIAGGNGLFANNQCRTNMKVGDLFIFPYDILHGVYPFNNTTECRRTLSYNCDLGNDLENLYKGLT